ncbi:MAG TPA: C40 family peptidase [Spirochaetia bacterium]|nr:C40 family peptidase [Spirochaetia bacterium]
MKRRPWIVVALVLSGYAVFAQPARARTEDSPGGSLPGSLVRFSARLLGTPYVVGGDSVQGVDCSGLISLVYRRTVGIALPGSVGALFGLGTRASFPLHLGDLLFFDTASVSVPSHPTHVGIYIGQGRVVHAASEGPRTGVIVSSLSEAYYQQRFLAARRVFPWPRPTLDMILTDDHRCVLAGLSYPSHVPLQIAVYNRMTGGGPMDLTVSRDDQPVMAQRVAPTAGKPVLLDLMPDIGRWTVAVTRILKGRTLGSLTFQVDE